jgi:hypothetical protein
VFGSGDKYEKNSAKLIIIGEMDVVTQQPE